MQRCQVSDLITVDASKRTRTEDGYLVAPGNLARAGNVQAYRASELSLDGDPSRIVRLYRPPEEVFAADAIKSFEAKPITLNHPSDGFVTSKNWRGLARGEVLHIVQDGDHLSGELNIRDAEAIAAIDAKEKEQLSAGYAFDFDETPGKSPAGESYDGIQRNIRGNHFAIVQAARGGETCRVADEQEPTMSTRKLVVDSVSYDLDEQAASLVESLVKARDAALSDLAEVQTERNTVVAAKDKLHIEQTATDAKTIADLKAKILTDEQMEAAIEKRAVERQSALAAGDALGVKVEGKGKSAGQIRREILAAAVAADETVKTVADAALGVEIDKASDVQIDTLVNVLAAQRKGKAANTNAQDAGIIRALGGTASEPTKGIETFGGMSDYIANATKARA
jgi:hypothetical protein